MKENLQNTMPGTPADTIYIDGHKITIRYSDRKNPAAISSIRKILLSNISEKKF